MFRLSPESPKVSATLKKSGQILGAACGLAGALLVADSMIKVYSLPSKFESVFYQTPSDLRPEITIAQAQAEVTTFNRNNEMSIRRGDLTITVPPDVAARLVLAYDQIDANNQMIREETARSKDLGNEMNGAIVELLTGAAALSLSIASLSRKKTT